MLNQYEIYYKENKGIYLDSIKEIETEDIYSHTNDIYDIMCLLNSSYHIGELESEHLFVVAMDGFERIMGVYLNNIGTPSQVGNDLRRTYIFLLLIGAEKFITVHNHTSKVGEDLLFPSEGDIEFDTQMFFNSLSLGLNYQGSYIITDKGYCEVSTKKVVSFF